PERELSPRGNRTHLLYPAGAILFRPADPPTGPAGKPPPNDRIPRHPARLAGYRLDPRYLPVPHSLWYGHFPGTGQPRSGARSPSPEKIVGRIDRLVAVADLHPRRRRSLLPGAGCASKTGTQRHRFVRHPRGYHPSLSLGRPGTPAWKHVPAAAYRHRFPRAVEKNGSPAAGNAGTDTRRSDDTDAGHQSDRRQYPGSPGNRRHKANPKSCNKTAGEKAARSRSGGHGDPGSSPRQSLPAGYRRPELSPGAGQRP